MIEVLKHNRIQFLLIATGLVFLGACLEPFFFEVDENFKKSLVIDGIFTNSDEISHEVRISRAAEFGIKVGEPELGASVSLSWSSGNATYDEVGDGLYILPADVIGRSGETYQLRVTLSDGSTYESQPQLMPESTTITDLSLSWEREIVEQNTGVSRPEGVINLFVDSDIGDLNGPRPLIKWLVIEAFSFPEMFCGGLHQPKTCYKEFALSSRSFFLFDGNQTDESVIEDVLVGQKRELSNVEFSGLHYFSVIQQTVTPEAFSYYSRINDLVKQEGTVFDLPPAAISGNVYNVDNPDETVLGYFEISGATIARISVLPSEFKSETGLNEPCNIFLRHRWIPACCNCFNIEGVTTERPPYF